MKNKFRINKKLISILLISLAALILRILVRDFSSMDMIDCLIPWYNRISEMGVKDALTNQVGDYNFLYQLIILILTKFPGEAIYKYKILSVIFDYVLAAGIYAFVKKLSCEKKAVLAYAITLFLPTVWLNSACWGQCDSIYVSFIVWSLYFLYSGRVNLSFVFLGISFAFKLQAVFILPFFGFVFIYGLIVKEKKIRLYHFAISSGTVVAIALPNIIAGRPLTDMIRVYKDQTESYKVIAKNYQSIWNLFRLTYDSDSKWCIGFTCLALIALMVFFYLKKADVMGKHYIWIAFLLSYTCVMFLPSMHERYGYLYEILVLIIAVSYAPGRIAALAFQLISLETYLYFLFATPLNIEVLSLLNVLIYAFMIYVFYRELDGRPLEFNLFEKADEFSVKENFKPGKKDFIAMIFLTGAFLIIGSMHLGKNKAPETYEMFGPDTEQGTEVYVTLNALQDVSSVCIYPMMSGKDAFELYYAVDGEWEKVDQELTLRGVFTWKKVDVNVRTHQFCIIFPDSNVEIAEIACFDPDGKKITLLDTNKPDTVFDEQDMVLTSPNSYDSMIFDEVYHGRTAYEFINGLEIYENTHPPLGKTLISIGIRLFGMNPFGYRIIVLLFGVMCIPVMYLLALRLTKDSRYAMLAGLLQITEFMHYSLSRISTIDIIVAFFVLCMFYGCIAFVSEEKNRYLVISGAAFAFGISTKWTAAYAAAGIALILFIWMIKKIREKKKASEIAVFVLVCIGSYIVFPAIVYVLSYIPFTKVYPDKNLIEHAVSNSVHMLEYHRNVSASHPYASPWYSWPFDWIPLIDSRTYIGDNKGVVATFVNPFVCYAGLVSVFHHIYMAIRKKDVTSALLTVMYVCMLLPWVFISRTVFIYQYFICTKVLILMICRSIQCMGFKHENSVIKFTAGVSVALFVMFFPVVSGIMVHKDYIEGILHILPDWWF